jgi:penicillin-binding protein 2
MGKRDSNAIARGRERLRTLGLLVGLMLSVMAVRLFDLQVVRHDQYARFAQDNQLQRERVAAPRGYFKDRNGRILVDNVLHFEVVMSWRERDDVADTVRRLAVRLPLDTTRVMTRYDAWAEKYGRRAFPIVPDADKFIISFVRENTDVFPELRVVSRSRRRYRDGETAAHMLGYVGEVSDADVTRAGAGYQAGDMVGKTALELRCEDLLRGDDGQRVMEVNASGTLLGEVKELSTPPVSGSNMVLTIEADLQAFIEAQLEDKNPGATLVMNVETGAILAAASHPSFEPNEFATGISQSSLDALFNAETKPLFNRISQARYPPASTFKIVSAHAIITNQLFNPGEVLVYCTGAHRFGNRVFRCWEPAGHGAMNLMTAIIQSCDVYFYKVAEIMDADVLAASARDFGLGVRTGLDVPGEVPGLVPDRDFYDRRFGKGRWTQGHMLNNIIGQGEYLVNTLQMARICAAIGNGGFLVTPHMIGSVEGEAPVAYARKRVPGLGPRTLSFLRRAMERVVSDDDGTANWTRMKWLPTAGKTGTAENPHGDPHAWYMAYAPADAPEIVAVVLVENAGHGGEVSAPMVRDIFKFYFGPPPEAAAGSNQAVSAPAQAPVAPAPARAQAESLTDSVLALPETITPIVAGGEDE